MTGRRLLMTQPKSVLAAGTRLTVEAVPIGTGGIPTECDVHGATVLPRAQRQLIPGNEKKPAFRLGRDAGFVVWTGAQYPRDVE